MVAVALGISQHVCQRPLPEPPLLALLDGAQAVSSFTRRRAFASLQNSPPQARRGQSHRRQRRGLRGGRGGAWFTNQDWSLTFQTHPEIRFNLLQHRIRHVPNHLVFKSDHCNSERVQIRAAFRIIRRSHGSGMRFPIQLDT